jgi:hypothetical protein|nr:MAG TPA: hypothetical protein [Caudoviricetes sp.]
MSSAAFYTVDDLIAKYPTYYASEPENKIVAPRIYDDVE